MLTGVTTIGYTETRKIEYFDNNAGFEGLNQLAKLMQLFALNYVTAKLYKNMRTFLEMVHGSVSSAWTIQNSQKYFSKNCCTQGGPQLFLGVCDQWLEKISLQALKT